MIKPEKPEKSPKIRKKPQKFSKKNLKFLRKIPKNLKNLPARFARRLGGGGSAGREARGYFPKKIFLGGILAIPPLAMSGLNSMVAIFYTPTQCPSIIDHLSYLI